MILVKDNVVRIVTREAAARELIARGYTEKPAARGDKAGTDASASRRTRKGVKASGKTQN